MALTTAFIVILLASLRCAAGSGILGGEASFDYVNKAQSGVRFTPLDGRAVWLYLEQV